MAQVRIAVDKGVCTACLGSGWDESIKEESSVVRIKKRKPTAFCLGKCTNCGGSGRRIDFE